jgi:hydrogenase-4 component B
MVIGMASILFIKPVLAIVSQSFNLPLIVPEISPLLNNLTMISILGGVFVLLVVILLVYRYMHLKTKKVETGPTWGCGYTAGTYKQQYTATSYAYNYNHLAKPLLGNRKIMEDIREEEIFPEKRSFYSHSEDAFKKYLIDKPVEWLMFVLKKLAIMQTGKIQHYILYAFVFMLVVFLLTFLNLI